MKLWKYLRKGSDVCERSYSFTCMLFYKACFQKLHLENSVQIQKQTPFSLKLCNETWHSFHQRKISEGGTQRNVGFVQKESILGSTGSRIFVQIFDVLILVPEHNSKPLTSLSLPHTHHYILPFCLPQNLFGPCFHSSYLSLFCFLSLLLSTLWHSLTLPRI